MTMPKLPEPLGGWKMRTESSSGYSETLPQWIGTSPHHESPWNPLFTADQMHAYARAYAEQRCAPLVEALEAVVTVWPNAGKRPGWVHRWMNAMSQARAALAAQEKQHG